MDILSIDNIRVYYKEKQVGNLFKRNDGSTVFVYATDWLKNGFSISPFLLPLDSKEFVCNDYLIGNMFGVFYDCLPDSWGNFLVDKYLASIGYNPNNISLFQRLSLLGEDSMGALNFKPNYEKYEFKKLQDFDKIKHLINKLEDKDRDFDEDAFDLYHRGSSTGGSRPKITYLFDDGEYIVKFPAKWDSNDVGFEEYRMNMIAKKCGLNVPDCKLVHSEECKGYFATKRFDRVNGEKKHIISLAGLFNLEPTLSQIHYKGFLQTVLALCPMDLEEAIKRMVFNYLIDNKDDHPRNFAFIYDDDNQMYRLAPFFDITSTPQIKEHMMQVNGKDNPTLEDFLKDVESVRFPKEKFIKLYDELYKIVKEHF